MENFERMSLVPTVIESTNRGERAYDIFSRLLKFPDANKPNRPESIWEFHISPDGHS